MSEETKTEGSKDEKLLAEAARRFQRAQDAYSESRNIQKGDKRFVLGSPDNNWQWENADITRRKEDKRPYLTINKLVLHVAQVVNDGRQNMPAIKVRPVDNGADVETAEVFNGVIRHIEAQSDADAAYINALEGITEEGEGYLRVLTDYADEKSFDQDIFIRRINNPFTVYCDPDAQEESGSDAKYWFIEDLMDRKEFEALYPNVNPEDWNFNDSDWLSWTQEDKVRVAEYFCYEPRKIKVFLWSSGEVTTSEEPRPEGLPAVEQPLREREVERRGIVWYKLCPQTVLEKREWAGQYWPIVRMYGNRDVVDGKITISGLVRNAKDAQRMYNFWVSQEAEYLSLWSKAPYVGPFEAFEGFEDMWRTANLTPRAYLAYNHVNDEGQPIPQPQRAQPPVAPAGVIQAKVGAADDIKATTGQFDASLGQRSNETSGRAILARQREGDTATYHYIDNWSKGIRQLGRILVDLIPKIYDTARVARMLGEDGEVQNAQIDPAQKVAMREVQAENGKIERIYNLGVGRYDVVSTTGPSFNTKRQEALSAMTDLVAGNPSLWGVIGDLMVKNMDWPGAEAMAKRLRAVLVPQVQQLLDDDQPLPPQVQAQLQQMQQIIQQLDQALQAASKENEQLQDKGRVEIEKTVIEQQGKEREILLKTAADILVKMQAPQPLETVQQQTMVALDSIMGQLSYLADQLAAPAQPEPPPELMAEPPPEMAMTDEPPAGGFFSPEPAPEVPPEATMA